MLKNWYRTVLLIGAIVIGTIILTACNSQNADISKDTNTKEETAVEQTIAESKEETVNFPTKVIEFIVPVSAGGGFDTMSRMLSPYWEKHLSNDATIIVKNMPGGQYNIGVNEVWRANPDGHIVGIFPGVIANQIISDVDYDLRKFEWIGQITESVFVQAVSKKSGFKSMEDIVAAGKVNTGIAGYTATAGIASLAVADAFGFEQNVISHKGSTEAILAAVRGDTDLVYQSYESLRQHFESGDLIPLWVGTSERIPELPEVPSILEFGEEYRSLVYLGSLPRFIGTTPGTPPEILEILRESFASAVNDPEFNDRMNKNETPTKYLNDKETAQMVDNVLKQYENYKEIIEQHTN